MDKIVFSDFDDTWDSHPELWGMVDAIVTGRSWEEAEELMDEKEGPEVPIFFNPSSPDEIDVMNVVNHKAGVINKSKATDYYEDQEEQVNMLKILCPKTKIHWVKEGHTSI